MMEPPEPDKVGRAFQIYGGILIALLLFGRASLFIAGFFLIARAI